MNFSVLMSVHDSANASYLDEAINSVVCQSLIPDEVVLVKDGKAGEGLEKVVSKWVTLLPGKLRVISLASSVGLGEALKIGTGNCRYEFIARMDADDVSLPNRFERQAEFLLNNPEVDVVGSWVGEFEDSTKIVKSVRTTPEHMDEIRRFARFRNPVNQPTVMFRRSAIERAGGYRSFEKFEDYDLWVRVLMTGGVIANLPEVLLKQRVGRDFYKRRGGWAYAMREFALQRVFLETGFIDWKVFLANIALRTCVRWLPNVLRSRIYRVAFRKSQ